MKEVTLKRVPKLETDAQAEAFLEQDLSDLDYAQFKPMSSPAAGKMAQREAVVAVFRDDAAGVWVTSSQDIPGLATESASLDALAEKLQGLVPDLCALNGVRTPQVFVLHVRLPPAAAGEDAGKAAPAGNVGRQS